MKRILLCCDGTWNRADQKTRGVPTPTNVLRTAFLAGKRKDDPQIILYDEGVGTGNIVDKLTGGAFGSGLETNIIEAYRFLVANYEKGDEIWMFGFSRGAFTARSIVGMVQRTGILKREFSQLTPDAWQLYRAGAKKEAEAASFRERHAILGDSPTPVKFVGIWDTVGSLGIPVGGLRRLTARRHQFHDTKLSPAVEFGYHALAIDEYREPFSPTLWQYRPKQGQTVEQAWFPGCHSNVGGGFLNHGLSDVALEWMLQKAKAAGLGIDQTALAANRPQPNPEGKLVDSRTFLFRALPKHVRKIGWMKDPDTGQTGIDPTQELHESTILRWKAKPSYRPKNLLDYFDAFPENAP